MSVRRWAARALDALAVFVVVAAVARFLVIPHLRNHQIVEAPPVKVAMLSGSTFDLQRVRGRFVFVDFWATWCDPCRQSIPLVQHFKRTHPSIDVVSVDVGEPPALVRPFAERFSMGDVALDPDQTVAHAFGVSGYPTMFAVDANGKVRARWIGYDPNIEREMADVTAQFAPKRPQRGG